MKITCAYCRTAFEGERDFCPKCGERIYIGTEAARKAKKKKSKVEYHRLESRDNRMKSFIKEQFAQVLLIGILAAVLIVLKLCGVI